MDLIHVRKTGMILTAVATQVRTAFLARTLKVDAFCICVITYIHVCARASESYLWSCKRIDQNYFDDTFLCCHR